MSVNKLAGLAEAAAMDEELALAAQAVRSVVPEKKAADEPAASVGYLEQSRQSNDITMLADRVRGVIGVSEQTYLNDFSPESIQAARKELISIQGEAMDVGQDSDRARSVEMALKDLAEIERRALANEIGTESLKGVDSDASQQQSPLPVEGKALSDSGSMHKRTPEEILNSAPEQALGAAGSVVGGVMGGLTDAVKGTVNLATKSALAATRGLSSVVKAPAKLSENIIQQHHDKKIDGVRNRIESLFGLQKQMKLVPSWATVVDDVEKLAKQANISKAEAMRKYESEPLGKANIEKALNDEKFKALRAQFDDGADLLEKDMAAAVDAAKKSGKNPEDISSFVEEQLEKLGEHLPGAMQKRLQEMAERIKEMVQRLLEFLHISKPSAGPALKPG